MTAESLDDLVARLRSLRMESYAGMVVALRARAEEAERARDVIRELYNAKSPLHERRKMPGYAGDNPESPDVLTTMGHWPECRCVECYAIHCLGESQAEVQALRTALRKWCIARYEGGEDFAGMGKCYLCDTSWTPETAPDAHAPNCPAEQIEKDIGSKASVGVTLKL